LTDRQGIWYSIRWSGTPWKWQANASSGIGGDW
jgi:hypothetical protein